MSSVWTSVKHLAEFPITYSLQVENIWIWQLDYLMKKELVARLYPESGVQWLEVQIEISDHLCPSWISTWNCDLKHCNQWHQCVIKCTLSKFAYDTKVCGWHTWGMGCHLDRPRQAWAVHPGAPHEVQQSQVQVLQLSHSNSWYLYKLQNERSEHTFNKTDITNSVL